MKKPKKPRNPVHAGWYLYDPKPGSGFKPYVGLRSFPVYLKRIKEAHRWLGQVIKYLEGKKKA